MTATLNGRPMSHEEFLHYACDQVKIHSIEEPTMLTRADDQASQGTLSFTSGLTPVLGFELVAFGVYDPEDLRSSATLIASNFPRGFPVDIPYALLKELSDQIPEATYKQYVVDESALENETEEVSDNPLWVADGGFPILTDAELQNELVSKMEQQTAQRHAGMEQVRENYRRMIEAYGFTVVAVFDPEHQQAPFLYSVGLTRKDLPEVIVSARLEGEFLHRIINHFGYEMIDQGFALRRMENMFTLTDDSSYDVRMVEVDPVHAKDRFLIQAEPILKEQVKRVVWVQISDENKRFPGDPDFNNKFGQSDIAPVISGGSVTIEV